MVGITFGGGFFDLSSMNDRLAANGYERLTGPFAVLGGEMRDIHENGFVTGIYGAAILDKNGDGPDGLRSKWSGGFGLVELGYAPVRFRYFTLSLSAQFGGFGVSLDITESGNARFDDVLAMPRRGTSLSQGGLLFGLMLRADGRIPIGDTHHDRQSYLAIGLRVNGLWGPAFGDWAFAENNYDAKNGPNANLTGAYAALVLGWGSYYSTPAP